MKRLLLISFAVLALLPNYAAARGRVGVFVGPGFGWYAPYYGMYPFGPAFGPYYGTPNAGQVKLDTKMKDADVYINDNFAGTVGQLKTMTMRPGDYTIDVRAPGRMPFEQRIYVVAGKTLTLRPDLSIAQ